jgi:sigma-B regulation protein RsbU (phosphoserine phosphatase)
MPNVKPPHVELEIAGFSAPKWHLGGDFYHCFDFVDDQAGLAVGDVSGKGVPAAWLVAVSVRMLCTQDEMELQRPANLLRLMNGLLKPQTRLTNDNVAMLYATIKHTARGQMAFTVSNAGLVSPILRRPGLGSEFLDACGLPLGVIDSPDYYECRFTLQSGDLILLCSDGLAEACNPNREMFGFDRLLETMDAAQLDITAAEFIRYLYQTVTQFVGPAPQHDDMTAVVVKVK